MKLSRQRLMTMALKLGADAPFFMCGRRRPTRYRRDAARGKSSSHVVCRHHAVVRVETAEIFAAPELTRNTRSAKMQIYSEGYGRNDLQAVAAGRFPEIAACLEALSRETSCAARSGCRVPERACSQRFPQKISRCRRWLG